MDAEGGGCERDMKLIRDRFVSLVLGHQMEVSSWFRPINMHDNISAISRIESRVGQTTELQLMGLNTCFTEKLNA